MIETNVAHLPKPPNHRKPMTLLDHALAAGLRSVVIVGVNQAGNTVLACNEKLLLLDALLLLERAKFSFMGVEPK